MIVPLSNKCVFEALKSISRRQSKRYGKRIKVIFPGEGYEKVAQSSFSNKRYFLVQKKQIVEATVNNNPEKILLLFNR